jgi:hypothetical protein
MKRVSWSPDAGANFGNVAPRIFERSWGLVSMLSSSLFLTLELSQICEQ